MKNTLDKSINTLVETNVLSESGGNWLRTYLDPFNDYQATPTGFPDSTSSLSLVRLIVNTSTVSAPAAGNWDCLICSTPINTDNYVAAIPATKNSIGWAYDHAAANTNLGGFVISKADTGTDLWPANSGFAATFAAANGDWTPLPNRQDTDGGRLVAQGFEIRNTTAELYKNGSVITGEVPNVRTVRVVHTSDTNAAPLTDGPVLGEEFLGMPHNAGQAIRYPNALQWKAAEGTYNICHMSDINPGRAEEDRGLVNIGGCASLPAADGALNGTAFPQFPLYETNNFNQSYAYFTGLSPETVLTVTTKSYYEIFPEHGSSMIREAKPSPPLDYAAMKLASMIVSGAPIAVPVGMNATGDYFRMIKKMIGSLLPYLPPVLGMVDPALGIAAKASLDVLTPAVQNFGDSLTRRRQLAERKKKAQKKKTS